MREAEEARIAAELAIAKAKALADAAYNSGEAVAALGGGGGAAGGGGGAAGGGGGERQPTDDAKPPRPPNELDRILDKDDEVT